MPLTPGRQYHITADLVVNSVTDGTVHITVEGHGDYELTPVADAELDEFGTWEEIEPAYTDGALYEAADGKVWRRHTPETGDSGGDLAWSPPELDHPNTYDYVPERDLTRLYPEDDLPE